MPTSASTSRTSTPVKRTSKAVTRVKPKPKPVEPETDVEVIGEDDVEGTFTAKLFGTDEAFTFYADANFLMLLIAYGGEGEDLAMLPTIIKGMIAVDEDSDEARRAEWSRFVTVLAPQRGMNAERSMRFINDLIAAAGKDQPESADD